MSYIDRLEEQADLLFNNVTGWEINALRRVGSRVKGIQALSHADLQSINNAAIVNQDVNDIMNELARLTEQSAEDVQKVYSDMLKEQHLENEPLYDYRNKPFIPFEKNIELQAIVRAYAKTTAETMVNLSMTKARGIGTVNKNGDFIPIEKSFKDVLDKAVMSVSTGTSDFNSEMRDVLKELGGSGLRVDYGGGITRRLDSMVRQNLLWGAKQASGEYNEMIGEELGCDGIEIDWHSHPRPSHEFMQGKQYVLGEARTIKGQYFESAGEALARLEDYGCLHFKTPIICGVSVPRHSSEELARLNEKNKKPITIDGVTKSGYEWKQTMRRLEAQSRNTKVQMEVLKASGNNAEYKKLKTKLSAIEDKYNQVAEGSGIKAQPQCMAIVKNKNISGETLTNEKNNGIIQSESDKNMLKVNTGGRRNEAPLTKQQIEEATEYAVSLGMPRDKIYYVEYDCTAYGTSFDMLRLGTDLYPAEEKQKDANSNVSMKGAIAHEIVGHRNAALKGYTQENDVLEEVQASIRAAKLAPDLSIKERIMLIRDGIGRLYKNNLKLKDVKDLLHIKEE